MAVISECSSQWNDLHCVKTIYLDISLSVNGIYTQTTIREHRVNTHQHYFIPLVLMYKHYLAAVLHLKLLYPFTFGLKA